MEPAIQPMSALWPARARRWKLRTRVLRFEARPLLMGILNVTPDSFSDGGRFSRSEQAIAQAERLIAEGADLLDIGGESTRPYADPVNADEELRRVMPVLERLATRCPIPISIDTTKAEVARRALEAGAEIVNDITGLTGDPAMIPVVHQFQAGVCAMHMQGTPQTMQNDPHYDNVVVEVFDYLRHRRDALQAADLDPEAICLDPGIGFGKTHQHNLELLAHCSKFHELGCPVLVGHSRKGFIGKVLGNRDTDRLYGTIGVALALARQGVQVIRVHDLSPVREALLLFEAAGGIDGCTRPV